MTIEININVNGEKMSMFSHSDKNARPISKSLLHINFRSAQNSIQWGLIHPNPMQRAGILIVNSHDCFYDNKNCTNNKLHVTVAM